MTLATNPNPDFWLGKRVLLTGHTGFKGGWLALWLHRLGAHVTGISLPPNSSPNLYQLAHIDTICQSHFVDVRDASSVAKVVQDSCPEVVFHLAAQALVRASYRDPAETYGTNVMGTVHTLDALRSVDSVKSVVVVTTDKVYQNIEHAFPYRETDALGGHDPYSASKAAAELVTASYRVSFLAAKNIGVASARAGNVIGGGDWSEDRLIPDAVRSWSRNIPLQIRRPQSTRPWQHVLEPLCGYLRLAEQMWHTPALAGAYNFGPQTHEAATVRDTVLLAQVAYGGGQVEWGDGSDGPHEAGWLALEVAKSRTLLGITPRWSLAETVQRTMHWYRQQQDGVNARHACLADLDAYEHAAPKPLP
jgi:CDP-glucose 4,6-dehydratase